VTHLTSFTTLELLTQRGEYAEALALYDTLEEPTPKDDRSAGTCLWGLSRYEDAKIPFYKAVQRGEIAASVDLVAIHIHLNEFFEAQEWIESCLTLELSLRDKIRLLLFQSEMQLKSGKIRQAIKTLKRSWIQANLLRDDANLLAQIAQSLASALHDFGNDNEALSYLNKVINRPDDFWKTFLKITRAYSLLSIGCLEEANDDLRNARKFSDSSGLLLAYQAFVVGTLSIARGKLDDAFKQLEHATVLSEKIDTKELQLLSRSALAATYTALGDCDQARAVLMPLSNLELSPTEEATRQLRVGELSTAKKDFDSARVAIESAVATFATLEHQRELAWALLRLAHLHLERGDTKLSNQTLERVSDIANSIGGTAFLVPELNLIGLETVKRLASIATPYAMHALIPILEPDRTVTIPLESRPLVRRLRVITLGKPMLLAEDRNVTPRLNKAMELIAYLVLHPQSSLERILDSVFPDSDPKAAANYFHQIRHKLTRDVPELRVVQDKQTKSYALDSGTIPLESDYEDVVKLLNHATQNELHQALEIYRGPFMPHLDSAWVEEVRNNVEWLLVRSGLRVVQDLYDRGSFEDCRKLTEKLRKVAPLDEGLNELLVRATNEIDGLLAARRTLSDVEKYFHAEVGELPPSLESLKQEIKLNLN
jgi:tetratricopeptide (TPR) repeat protein